MAFDDRSDFSAYCVRITDFNGSRDRALCFPLSCASRRMVDEETMINQGRIYRSEPLIVGDHFDFRLTIHYNASPYGAGIFLQSMNEEKITVDFFFDCVCEPHLRNKNLGNVLRHTFVGMYRDFGYSDGFPASGFYTLKSVGTFPDTINFKVYLKLVNVEE